MRSAGSGGPEHTRNQPAWRRSSRTRRGKASSARTQRAATRAKRLLLTAGNQRVLQKQVFDAGPQKGFDRLLRSVDDRLPLHIEAGVEQHFPARGLSYSFQKSMKIGIIRGGHGLHASRAVNMGDGRELGAMLFANVDGGDHVG